MIAEFRARSSLHGQSIVLDWVWKSADVPAASFQLVRCVGRYEKSPECGTQLDLADLVTVRGIDPSTGGYYLHLSLEDKNLEAGIYYYYTLSAADSGNVTYSAQACALSTKNYGLSEQLYRLLPGILKFYDNPAGAGPLKRFLELFGLTLDQARGYAESLSDRHDIFMARSDLLPHLASLIGWNLDQTLDVAGQRHEVAFAPEVHQKLGTLPALRAMVNRASGWDCQIREFAKNVFFSNAPEPNQVWELWSAKLDENGLGEGKPLHRELGEWFEGRPAVIKIDEQLWVFWSSNRYGRHQVYLQRLNAETLEPSGDPEPVTPFEVFFGSPEWVVDEDPAVTLDATNGKKLWLFWSSNRSGHWDIWARTFDLTQTQFPLPKPEFEFARLTYHQAEDRRPAAIAFSGSLWLFWQSNRRGPTDIWVQTLVNNLWTQPRQATSAIERDESPTVAASGTKLWLAWQSRTRDGSYLYCKVFEENMGLNLPICKGESPALIYQNNLKLFYHATADKRTSIWEQTYTTNWSAPKELTSHFAADKEPAVIAIENEFRVFWRSQERCRYFQSRTVSLDPNNETDQETLSLRQTAFDRLHYTYDPGVGLNNWYSLNTVGIYLQPENPDNPDEMLVLRDQDRTYIESIIREFLPAHVRALLFLSEVVSEQVYGEGEGQGIAEEHDTDIITQLEEVYPGVSVEFYDETPDWGWLRAWYAGLDPAEIATKIGKSNDQKWRTVHTNFKIPPTGG